MIQSSQTNEETSGCKMLHLVLGAWSPAAPVVLHRAYVDPSTRCARIPLRRRHPESLPRRRRLRSSLWRSGRRPVDALARRFGSARPAAGERVLFCAPPRCLRAARRRFNVAAQAPGGGGRRSAGDDVDSADWVLLERDRRAGQSGSPDSPHYADLAALWSGRARFPWRSRSARCRHTPMLTLVGAVKPD